MDKLLAHECSKCQPPITERDLTPLYAQYDEQSKEAVLMVKNAYSERVEPYRYDFATNSFVFDRRNGWVYEVTKKATGALVATFTSKETGESVTISRSASGGIVKHKSDGKGGFTWMPEARVSTWISQNLEKAARNTSAQPNNPQNAESNVLYREWMDALIPHCSYPGKPELEPYFLRQTNSRTDFCVHRGTYYVAYYNTLRLKESRFVYCGNGNFKDFDCAECAHQVEEEHLLPKYVEEVNGRKLIHVFNKFTLCNELYYLDLEDFELIEVFHQGVEYNPELESEATNILVMMEDGKLVAICRDEQGRILKELCHQFIILPPAQVRTLLFMRANAIQNQKVQTNSESSAENLPEDVLNSKVQKEVPEASPVVRTSEDVVEAHPEASKAPEAPEAVRSVSVQSELEVLTHENPEVSSEASEPIVTSSENLEPCNLGPSTSAGVVEPSLELTKEEKENLKKKKKNQKRKNKNKAKRALIGLVSAEQSAKTDLEILQLKLKVGIIRKEAYDAEAEPILQFLDDVKNGKTEIRKYCFPKKSNFDFPKFQNR
ncbi:Protein CBG20384 [Caenorhabditis briggsae]|uniref:Protein CBG20384 n=1 Tax=Caenorhabditis briggsae TaxID=6238 RepID=A8XXN3_CAEBR|nr:Protein CBG20384 [Caenorhabditis briggsae]CAP37402.1 Protein CBG20384 [Caenorhabditis briggsae]